MKRIIIFFLMVLLVTPIVFSPDLEIGFDVSSLPRVDVDSGFTFNTVNHSDYWGGHYYTDYDLLVPYAGATSDVDLGLYDLIAANITLDGTNIYDIMDAHGGVVSDDYVNESGDTMTGGLNMTKNDITDVGRMILKEDGSIWFGSSAARIYSGGTNYVFIQASDTIELKSANEIIFRADNDLNDLHVFGVTDYGAIDTPYFGTLYSDMELRPGTGNVNVIGNLDVDTNLTVDANTLFVNANNNRVGIGTGSPVGKLNTYDTATDNQIQLQAPSPAGYGFDSTGNLLIIIGGNDTTGQDAGIAFRNEQSNTKWVMGLDKTDDKLHIAINSFATGQRLTILPSGNVGIGTTSPVANLQISTHTGTIPANTGIWITGPKTLRFGSSDNNAGYGAYIQPAFEGAGTERSTLKLGTRYGAVDKVIMTLKNSGNVGIGTISPNQTLYVVGNTTINDGSLIIKDSKTCTGGCETGQVAWNSTHVCVCTSTDNWRGAKFD